MKKTYTVTFKVEADPSNFRNTEMLEFEIKDLVQIAVLPTLDLNLVPLTFTVKKARG